MHRAAVPVLQGPTILMDHQDPQGPRCLVSISSLHIVVLAAPQGQDFAVPLTEPDVSFTPVLQVVPLASSLSSGTTPPCCVPLANWLEGHSSTPSCSL